MSLQPTAENSQERGMASSAHHFIDADDHHNYDDFE